MRIANHHNRAVLLTSDEAGVDIHTASAGRFGPDLPSLYNEWEAFTRLGAGPVRRLAADVAIDRSLLGSPSPAPRQMFAIGLNYSEHAKESGFEAPGPAAAGVHQVRQQPRRPGHQVVLPEGGNTDWEVELVAVIGTEARNVSAADAWEYVAGLSVGQDISERVSQLARPGAAVRPRQVVPRLRPRRARGWSPRTSSATRTIWNSGAASTAKRSRRAAPAT